MLASVRYYLYRSPWFLLFNAAALAMVFAIAAAFSGQLSPVVVDALLLCVIGGLGIGACGMALEVANELDEEGSPASDSEYRFAVEDFD